MELYDIIQAVSQSLRKGPAMITKGNVTEIYNMSHTDDVPIDENLVKVNMIFIDVVVNKEKAEEHKARIVEILEDYPDKKRLAGGPSYIELAPNLGLEQGSTLKLMAIGQVLGLWNVRSAKDLGMDDDVALDMAGSGFLMITGYPKKHPRA